MNTDPVPTVEETRPPRGLLVERDASLRAALAQHLAEAIGGAVEALPNRTNLVWAMLRRQRFDYLVLDADLLRTHGVFFLRMVVLRLRLPVMILGESGSEQAPLGLAALASGARGVVPRPRNDSAALRRAATRIARWVREEKHRRPRSTVTGPFSPPTPLPPPPDPVPFSHQRGVALIAIGASAGGPEALRQVLERLAPDLPPILIVQHMPKLFTRSFAERLNGCTEAEVLEAVDGLPLRAGRIVLGQGDRHLRVVRGTQGLRVAVEAGELVSGHRPSVDVLFHSVAATAGPRGLGCLLTGMGADGAEGLRAMRENGAWTIAQDRASSVVYGMPGEAVRRGAACEVRPLGEIPHRLHELVAQYERAAGPRASAAGEGPTGRTPAARGPGEGGAARPYSPPLTRSSTRSET